MSKDSLKEIRKHWSNQGVKAYELTLDEPKIKVFVLINGYSMQGESYILLGEESPERLLTFQAYKGKLKIEGNANLVNQYGECIIGMLEEVAWETHYDLQYSMNGAYTSQVLIERIDIRRNHD